MSDLKFPWFRPSKIWVGRYNLSAFGSVCLYGVAALLVTCASLPLVAQEAELKAADPVVSTPATSEHLYEKNRIIDVKIEMVPEDWSKLSKQMRDIGKAFTGQSDNAFTWFQGTVFVDGVKIESVGIRKKGFIGSLDEHAPSLKIDFSRYVKQQPFSDVDVLTLNNNKQDESLLSQTLAYRTFDSAGVAAPKCNFAKVTVNGKYLGLYTNVEGIDEYFLNRQFGSHDGDLYEGTVTDFYPKTVQKIEVKNNKKKSRRPRLDELADLLASNEQIDLERIGTIVDVDNFLRYWATESLLAFWDGYANNQNNYWFYDDPETGKFRFIPWGADMTMEASRGMPQFGPPGPVSLYAQSYLTNRLIHHPEISSKYRATMQNLLDEVWKEESLLEQIDELEKIVKPHLGDRQRNATEATKRLREFVKNRRAKIDRELAKWPVVFPSKPRKPSYLVELGAIEGNFTTVWMQRRQHGPAKSSQLRAELILNGQPISFEGHGAAIYEKSNMGFPFGPPGPNASQVEILLIGKPEGAGKPSRILISIDRSVYDQMDTESIPVTGQYFEGGAGPGFMPFTNKSVTGTIKFSMRSSEENGAVEGTFDLQLWQLRGGFFDRSPDSESK